MEALNEMGKIGNLPFSFRGARIANSIRKSKVGLFIKNWFIRVTVFIIDICPLHNKFVTDETKGTYQNQSIEVNSNAPSETSLEKNFERTTTQFKKITEQRKNTRRYIYSAIANGKVRKEMLDKIDSLYEQTINTLITTKKPEVQALSFVSN